MSDCEMTEVEQLQDRAEQLLLQWYSNSGSDRFADVENLEDNAAKEKLIKEIRSELLSEEEKKNLCGNFLASIGVGGYESGTDADLIACACCGARQFSASNNPTIVVKDVEEELSMLKLGVNNKAEVE
eukprot:CAMPEP_0116021200 /NCGR_PEP_ID=MMETSP0321-20121206/10242_1 /TAXON_ID=163516 /ORGANISM="Leptocylindrus danicus var. danicus, Strain B650" /LENGTH=127 /DNA_ID=CAMNT_0003492019 /DNA_START=72 /DNA_END=452 /DNA_ORIENTATION=-